MKFQFKMQPYQTEAVNSVVNVFAGQPFAERVCYVRDYNVHIWLEIIKDESPVHYYTISMTDVQHVNRAILQKK